MQCRAERLFKRVTLRFRFMIYCRTRDDHRLQCLNFMFKGDIFMHIHSMAASHAAGKGSEPDSVFAVVSRVREAKKQPDADKVVDGSIGAIHDEEGNFSILPIVNELYRQMTPDELMNYATITGSPEFLQAAIDYTFQGFQPEGTIARAVGTPGGTGAIRSMIYNYLNNGETVLIPDWYWAPYKTIAQENQRVAETYTMFDRKSKILHRRSEGQNQRSAQETR